MEIIGKNSNFFVGILKGCLRILSPSWRKPELQIWLQSLNWIDLKKKVKTGFFHGHVIFLFVSDLFVIASASCAGPVWLRSCHSCDESTQSIFMNNHRLLNVSAAVAFIMQLRGPWNIFYFPSFFEYFIIWALSWIAALNGFNLSWY